MIRAIATAAFLFVTTVVHAQSLTLEPYYKVSGKNPNGTNYHGEIFLKRLSTTTFAVRWNIGPSTYTGFGMRMNNMLSATYTINGRPGLVISEVQPDGSLNGLWAVRDVNGSGTELLTK